MIDREDVDAAAERIAGLVRRTPVVDVEAGGLVAGPVVCKLELLQHTGSFKPRGATNRMLAAEVPDAGVIAASGGNHGAAVAHVAARLGHRAEIFVPTTSADVKVERIAALGASVRQIVEAVARALGRPVPHTTGGRREGDPPSLVADASRAKELLGWEPVCSTLDEIVRDALRWEGQPRYGVGGRSTRQGG